MIGCSVSLYGKKSSEYECGIRYGLAGRVNDFLVRRTKYESLLDLSSRGYWFNNFLFVVFSVELLNCKFLWLMLQKNS